MSARYRIYCTTCHVACDDSVDEREASDLWGFIDPKVVEWVRFGMVYSAQGHRLFLMEPMLETVEADSGLDEATARFLTRHAGHQLTVRKDEERGTMRLPIDQAIKRTQAQMGQANSEIEVVALVLRVSEVFLEHYPDMAAGAALTNFHDAVIDRLVELEDRRMRGNPKSDQAPTRKTVGKKARANGAEPRQKPTDASEEQAS